MSAKIITDTSRVKPDVSARVWDLYVDGEIIPGIPPGTITPGANNTFLRTNNLGLVQWNPFTLSDIPHGATGTVLSSNGSAISWQVPSVAPGGITPGTNGQILVTQGGVSQWTSNPNIIGNLGVTGSSRFTANGLFQQDLAVTNDLNVLNGDLTVINGGFEVTTGLSKVQDLDINGDLFFNTSSGITGQYVQQSGTGPHWVDLSVPTASIIPGSNNQALFTRSGNVQFSSIIPADITTGSANQFLVKDVSGTKTVFTSNPVCPGNFRVNGSTNLIGDLQFNSSSGSIGDIITKTGATTQQWATPTNVRCIRYVTYFASQNLNAGVGFGPIPIVFDNVNVISNYSAGSSTSVAGISQPDTTSFLIGTLGAYDIDITGYCSGAGIGNSGFAITAEVNGTEIYRSIVSNYRGSIFTGKLPSILISAGSTLKLLTTSIAGAGALSTNAPLSAFPNYSSTIAISLVNTV